MEIVGVGMVKRANAAAGYHFFDRDTMRFFDSRVSEQAYRNGDRVWFVTSERFHGTRTSGPRRYTVRVCDLETGKVDSVSDFQAFGRLPLAHKWAAEMAERDQIS
jgi:NADPH-dependent ferric siderophore reductase